MLNPTRNRTIGATLSLIGLLSLSLTTTVFAQSVLIGGTGDLGSDNSFPLTVNQNGRYQQVYNGSLFPSSFTIGSITFFNNNFQPGTAVIDTANYSIHLSTTSKPVNGLDTSVSAPMQEQTTLFSSMAFQAEPSDLAMFLLSLATRFSTFLLAAICSWTSP